jgi:hypothetical protein
MNKLSSLDIILDIGIFGTILPMTIAVMGILMMLEVVEITDKWTIALVVLLNSAMLGRTSKSYHYFNRDRLDK